MLAKTILRLFNELMLRHKQWTEGTLFHNFNRYAEGFAQTGTADNDRLTLILKEGLRAPGHQGNGSRVVSDLDITVTGCETAYDSVVFLHKYRQAVSGIYLLHARSDYICLVLDEDVPVKTADEMGANWPVLSQSEVYATEPIGPEHFTDIHLPARYLREDTITQALAGLAIQPHAI